MSYIFKPVRAALPAQVDYLVVGAGSAGCVVADRLSESGRNRVLVLEAGPRDGLILKVPGAAPYIDASQYDWGFRSLPDSTRAGRQEHWFRGRTVGGSSSINGMNYVRGAASDYDRWADLGNLGWSAKELMPLFKSLERCDEGFALNTISSVRGTKGRLHIRQVQKCHEITEAFLKAAEIDGFRRNLDYNAAEQEGVGYAQFNQRRGLRCSAADAFLKPALRRRNIRLFTDSFVQRLVIKNGRVSAVRVERNGKIQNIFARYVVVCAGAINTPKLLMLSGIGEARSLARLGIEVAIDSPAVGKNLLEHPLVRVIFKTKCPTYNPTGSLWQKTEFLWKYLRYGQGPLATPCEAQAFLRTSSSETTPDVQMHLFNIGIAPALRDRDFFEVLPYPSVLLFVNKSHPKSRGEVRLASNNPADSPLIDPKMLENEEDVTTLVRGTELARRIAGTDPLARFLDTEAFPGPEWSDRTKLSEYVRANTEPASHPAGTCRMGNDVDSVVTPDLRVKGIDNLWIADASVMPDLISGNINAACMMIGEKLGRQLSRSNSSAS